jgi:hypothetical protein
MAGAGIQSFAKFRAQMCTAECQGFKTVTRFVAFRGKFKRGTVRSVAFRCQILQEELAFRSILASGGWHSAVHLRAVCQEAIPVVAIRARHLDAELGK